MAGDIFHQENDETFDVVGDVTKGCFGVIFKTTIGLGLVTLAFFLLI